MRPLSPPGVANVGKQLTSDIATGWVRIVLSPYFYIVYSSILLCLAFAKQTSLKKLLSPLIQPRRVLPGDNLIYFRNVGKCLQRMATFMKILKIHLWILLTFIKRLKRPERKISSKYYIIFSYVHMFLPTSFLEKIFCEINLFL